jgi:hypothetical protein
VLDGAQLADEIIEECNNGIHTFELLKNKLIVIRY